MRFHHLAILFVLASCGSSDDTSTVDSSGPSDARSDTGRITDAGIAADTGLTTTPPTDTGVATDATTTATDTESVPTDTETVPTDTATTPTDTETVPTDTATTPTDTGVPDDTATTPTDTGVPDDTATTPTDTGVPADTATTPTDTGAPADTATTPTDTGVPADTATTPTDTGVPADTATTPTDTGAPADTATTPTDTGAPADTATTPTDTGAPTDTGTPTINTSFTSGVLTATLTTTSTWGTGYCANVVVQNNGTTAVTDWSLTLVLNQATYQSGSPYNATAAGNVITPASYDQAIAANASVTFGYCVDETGSDYSPAITALTATFADAGTDAGIDTSVPDTTDTSVATDTGADTKVTDTAATDTGTDTTTTDTAPTDTGSTCGGGSAQSSDVTVNVSSLQQKISGFGASTAWGSSFNNSTTDPDTLWSTTTGAGLSLHRIRIDPSSDSTSEVTIAQSAVAHGVTVWATPWTPPAADKSNNNTVMGTLTNPSAFATYLVNFVNNMKNNGVNIYAISAQNEPDANVTYESCVYSAAQMTSWVGGYLGPAFAGTSVKVMAPETQNWCGFQTFEPTMIADTNTMKYISIFATHEYGCSPAAYPAIQADGKEFWETEIYDTSGTVDDGIGSGLTIAGLIHNALTVANMNAWHHWWVYGAGNQSLYDTTNNVWTKRLWVMGNYARFIRPGYQRVATSGTSPSGVLISAYINPTTNKVVVVAINNNTSSTNASFFLSGDVSCTIEPYVTSSASNLAQGTAVTVANSRFTATLAAQSVTTFVGQ